MWLSSHLYVTFGAEELLICAKHLWPRTSADSTVIPIEKASGAEPPWQPWIRALMYWLTQQAHQKYLVHIVLSDHFVRYLCLPWRPGIVRSNEWEAYGRHRFREIYGQQMANWRLVVEPAPPGRAALACAMEAKLLDALQNLSKPSLRLVSVQPRFVSRYNHWKRRLRGPSYWFIAVETGRACAALMEKGRWLVLRNESITGPILPGLAALLHRQELNMPSSASARPIYLSGNIASPAPSHVDGRPLHLLSLSQNQGSGRYQIHMAKGI